MISRKTAKALGEVLNSKFFGGYEVVSARRDSAGFEDFLDDSGREYPLAICRSARSLPGARKIQEFVTGLQSGASFHLIFEHDKSPAAQRHVAAKVLEWMVEDVLKSALVHKKTFALNEVRELQQCLELDGYSFVDGHLVKAESESQEVAEERGELEALYARLNLGAEAVVLKHLRDSEDRYITSAWGDCIHNSRIYLEKVLKEVALSVGKKRGTHNNLKDTSFAHNVRTFLKNEGIFTEKEVTLIDAIYGLLSDTGSHANMSEKEQARIFRRMALSMALYTLLRYEAETASSP